MLRQEKKHVVIKFWPPINVAAAELSICLILSGQIKIGEYLILSGIMFFDFLWTAFSRSIHFIVDF